MGELWYKAKRIINDEWVEGYYIHDHLDGGGFIYSPHAPRPFSFYRVCLSTLCQYTGEKDSEGKRIFRKVEKAGITYPPLVDKWISVQEKEFPKDKEHVLVSFENCPLPAIAVFREDGMGGTFFPENDEDVSYVQRCLFVNAWAPLPKSLKQ